MINVGDIARDSITGFEGVVVGRTEWLNGCARLGIQPQKLDKDGKPIEAQWFDLELASAAFKQIELPGVKTGK